MSFIKKILSDQAGFILPTALVLLILGGLLVVPSLYLLQTSLKSGDVVDANTKALYAADAGVEHAIWRLKYDASVVLPSAGNSIPLPVPDMTINDASVAVTLSNEGDGNYKITSVATRPDGHNATIESYVSNMPGGSSIFNNALVGLNSDITLSGAAHVISTPDGGGGDIYANGNVSLSGSAWIDGHANATGTISTSGGAHIDGGQTPNATPLDAAALATAMNTLINNWKATAQNVTCATCSTSYTRTSSTWTAPAGTYNNNEYVKNNMAISASSGTWTFNKTVCVGAYVANKDFTISGNGTRTFVGPVKVGRDLKISAYGGTITFKDTVCVSRNLIISGGATVIFEGKVSVGGDFSDSQYSPGSVQLKSSLYVASGLDLSGQAVLISTCPSGPIDSLNCPIYVHGYIRTANSSRLDGGQNVIADGNITVDNASQLNTNVSSMYIPFIISTGGNIAINNSGDVAKAILYAPASSPNGSITLSGAAILTGCAVGRTVDLGNSGVVVYPEEFENRQDLPTAGGVGMGGGWSIQSYNVL